MKIKMNSIEISELDNYLANRFVRQNNIEENDYFLAQWHKWLRLPAAEVLNNNICSKRTVKFSNPEDITIEIYSSPAGKVPVIVFGNASDFEGFIVNLIYKGERPEDISQMGASFIYGKTQRFLVLSKKYYSNTEPEYVGLSPDEWREKSVILRREHECIHYYTKKYYGSAANNIHDELIADFFGIYEAFGHYDAKLFLHFMGLDGRQGGRFPLYTSGLSQNAKEAAAELARECSAALERWSKSDSFYDMSITDKINFLCERGVKDLCNI